MNGWKTKPTDMAFIPTLTGLSMKAIGRKTNRTEMELSLGQMELRMRENISKERNADSENSNGLMALFTKVNSLIIISMAKAFIPGETNVNILAIGKTIKWMDKEYSLGLTRGSIRASIGMIKRMAMEYSNGNLII